MSRVLVDQLRALAQRLGRAPRTGRHDGTRKFWLVAQQLRATLPPLILPGRTGTVAPRIGYLVHGAAADFLHSSGDIPIADEAIHVYLRGVFPSLPATSGAKVVDLNPLNELQAARAIAEDDLDLLVDVDGAMLPHLPITIALHPARAVIEPAFVPPLSGPRPPMAPAHDIPLPDREQVRTLVQFVLDTRPEVPSHAPSAASLNQRLNQGIHAHQAGEVAGARTAYAEVLAAHPGHPIAAYLLGQLDHQVGNDNAAISSLRVAIDAAPEFRDAHYTLGQRYLDVGRWQEAAVAYRRALDLTPGFAAAWSGLGLATARLGHADQRAAVGYLERATALEPNVAQWSFNLGAMHQRAGAQGAARGAYARALTIDPGHVDAQFNLAAVMQAAGEFSGATELYRKVIAARPDAADAYAQLGACLQQSGLIEAWLENYRQFCDRCPEALAMAVYGLEASMAMGDAAGHARWRDRLVAGEFAARDADEHTRNWEQLLFLLLHVDVDRAQLFEWYVRYNEAAVACYGWANPPSQPRRPGPLRVGYISGDLRNHVMGRMVWELVRHHDRTRFAPHLYSLTIDADAWTARFRALEMPFVDLSGKSAPEAAARIAEDDLDLLIDCCGHTRGAQQGVLALKPARVMATHIATPGPVGLAAIDYKLTDEHAESPDAQRYLIERLQPVRDGVFPWHRYAAATAASRDEFGIAREAFVCGAFVSLMKLSPRCLDLWRRVLEAVPRAILAFSPNGAQWRDAYLRWLSAHGIAADRIAFIPSAPDEAAALARYRLLDVALDPMPCGNVNGTMEALAMGVPVVTLAGVRHGERLGNALLRRFGIVDTIAGTEAEYVAVASRLANDAPWSADLRERILAAAQTSPAWNAEDRTRGLEAAIDDMIAGARLTSTA